MANITSILKETSRTYTSIYREEKIIEHSYSTWFSYQELSEILKNSDSFFRFLIDFDISLKRITPFGWNIENEGYCNFMNNPYFDGNANMMELDNVRQEIIGRREDGKYIVCIEIPLSVTISTNPFEK